MSSPATSSFGEKRPLEADVANSSAAASSDTNSINSITFTEAEEKALLRKIDFALLPGLTFLYLLSFLDRSNVGNAKLYGLLKSIGAAKDTSIYNTALALFFVGYVLGEIPANAILKRFNPRAWLPTLTIVYGITGLCQGFVTNKSGFLAARFFMGLSEAGLFPGIVFVFSMFYKRKERHWRVSVLFGGAAVAGAFGGVLAYGISFMEGIGGHPAWKFIFWLEGAFTVLVGLTAYFWVPGWPREATFLNDRERQILLARLSADSDSADREAFKISEVKSAVTDHLVQAFGALFHGFAFPLYSLSLFLPTIIQQLGFATWKAQIFTVPIYTFAFLMILLAAWLSARTDRRGLYIIVFGFVAIIGYIVILATHTPGARLAGSFFAVGGIYASVALTLAWPSENIQNQTRRATATANQIFIGDIGAIVGVLVYRPSLSVHFYRTPHIVAIAYTLFGMLSAAWLWFWMSRQNAQRQAIIQSHEEDGSGHPVSEDKRGDRAVTFVYQL